MSKRQSKKTNKQPSLIAAIIGTILHFRAALITLAFILIGVFVWASYNAAKKEESMPVPVIYAEKEPFKIKPKNPGGALIPHQDNSIYNILENKEDWRQISLPEKKIEAVPAEPPKAEIIKKEDPKPLPKVTKKPQMPTKPAPVKKEIKKEITGTHYIQLASFRTMENAQNGYKGLIKKHPSLKALTVRYQKADVKDKGTFIRVQAGPANKDRASAICNTIKSEKGSCYVVAK